MNVNYTDHTLTEAIEAVRLKMISDAFPARQSAVDAAIAEVDLAVLEYFVNRAENARERVYARLAPLMPELPAPAPTALQSDPGPYSNGNDFLPADMVEPEYVNPRFMGR